MKAHINILGLPVGINQLKYTSSFSGSGGGGHITLILCELVNVMNDATFAGKSSMGDGTAMAAHEDIVFVSINYRLGALGEQTVPFPQCKDSCCTFSLSLWMNYHINLTLHRVPV